MLEQRNLSGSVSVLVAELANRLAEIFAAMGDPNRLRIIAVLAYHELRSGEVSALVGMTESATSHQLRLLRTLRIVRARKVGRQVFYALDDEHIHDLLDRGVAHLQHESSRVGFRYMVNMRRNVYARSGRCCPTWTVPRTPVCSVSKRPCRTIKV